MGHQEQQLYKFIEPYNNKIENLWWVIYYYNGHIFATALYDNVSLIHDVDDGGKVTVFIDGKQVFETKDKGPRD